jgi:hypothetical protein
VDTEHSDPPPVLRGPRKLNGGTHFPTAVRIFQFDDNLIYDLKLSQRFCAMKSSWAISSVSVDLASKVSEKLTVSIITS